MATANPNVLSRAAVNPPPPLSPRVPNRRFPSRASPSHHPQRRPLSPNHAGPNSLQTLFRQGLNPARASPLQTRFPPGSSSKSLPTPLIQRSSASKNLQRLILPTGRHSPLYLPNARPPLPHAHRVPPYPRPPAKNSSARTVPLPASHRRPLPPQKPGPRFSRPPLPSAHHSRNSPIVLAGFFRALQTV